MTDLIKRDDALALCDRYPYVEGVKSALEDLPAIDPAAIREAALREAANIVEVLKGMYEEGGSPTAGMVLGVALEGILALIKGETK